MNSNCNAKLWKLLVFPQTRWNRFSSFFLGYNTSHMSSLLFLILFSYLFHYIRQTTTIKHKIVRISSKNHHNTSIASGCNTKKYLSISLKRSSRFFASLSAFSNSFRLALRFNSTRVTFFVLEVLHPKNWKTLIIKVEGQNLKSM